YLADRLDRIPAGGGRTATRDFAWWRLARHTLHPGVLPLVTGLGTGVLGAIASTAAYTLAAGLWAGGVFGLLGALMPQRRSPPRSAGGFRVPPFLRVSRPTAVLLPAVWLLVFALFLVPVSGTDGVAIGLGLALGLVFLPWHRGSAWTEDTPGFADFRLTGRLRLLVGITVRSMLLVGLMGGLAFGTMGVMLGWLLGTEAGLGQALGLAVGIGIGTLGGAATGLVGGLGFGLLEWAETPTPDGRANTPPASWRTDRALNLLRFAVIGCLTVVMLGMVGASVGAMMGTGSGLVYGNLGAEAVITGALMFGPRFAIGAGVGFGLVGGIGFGRHHAWMAYLPAVCALAWRRRLPLRLMPFLEDAHRLGLLRAVGPVYQFRHAQLHDHLAAAHRSEGAEG
ncbi:hypothetical protein ACFQZ2_08950, partial [Streptomonospora algeriensis]